MVSITLLVEYESTGYDMVANPARGELNSQDFFFSLSPFAAENLVSRDGFGRPASRQPTYPQAESTCDSHN